MDIKIFVAHFEKMQYYITNVPDTVYAVGEICRHQSMTSHNVDSDEAMKRGDEALNASSLQFLRSV